MVTTQIKKIDLTDAPSETQLLSRLARAFRFPERASEDWDDLLQALAEAPSGLPRLVLQGLRELEDRQPQAAAAMMRAFSAHNRRAPETPVTVEVDHDYRARVVYLQFSAERETGPGREHAYISCWVKKAEANEARSIAEEEISGLGWSILSLNESHEVSVDDYPDTSENLGFLRQAFIDGAVYVFDTWLA